MDEKLENFFVEASQNKYGKRHAFNIDFFFYYLQQYHNDEIKIKTFVPENVAFVHWCGPHRKPLLYKFCKNFVCFDISLLSIVSKQLRLGRCKLPPDTIVVKTPFTTREMNQNSQKKKLKIISSEYGKTSFSYLANWIKIKLHYITNN